MRNLRSVLLLAAFLVGSAAPASAQTEAPMAEDPLFDVLFPPELIMQHRRAIDLTDEPAFPESHNYPG